MASGSNQVPILIATNSQHLAASVDRTCRCAGLSATVAEPTAENLARLISESHPCVVILDAIQSEAATLAILRRLASSRHAARLVVVGRNANVGLVARAAAAGASHFLTESTPADEFAKAITGLISGQPVAEETVYGRVYGCLPKRLSQDRGYCLPSGGILSAEEAIKQCDKLGLPADEIADYLSLPVGEIERAKAIKGSSSPSLVSRISESLLAEAEQQPGGLPSLKAVLATIAVLAGVGLAASYISRREPHRHIVRGEVTYQGRPVKVGLIRFTPVAQGESARPILSGEIRDGKYALKSGHGCNGGFYKVRVSAFTGIPKPAGPIMDPLGEPLCPDVTRDSKVPCSDFTLNVKCD